MTSHSMNDRLRRIETKLGAGTLARLTDEELDANLADSLAEVCEPYGSVNATADALRHSPDQLDRDVAEQLDWYIGMVLEERAAGRAN